MRAVTLLVAMPRLMSKRVCLEPYQKLTLEMVMRISAGAAVSRCAPVVAGGYVYGHCRPHRSVHGLSPRNRNATGKYGPRDNIDNQDQREQNETSCPSLPMPILKRGEGMVINHDWKGRGGLVPAVAPKAITKSGEKQRAVSPATRAKARRTAVRMPR